MIATSILAAATLAASFSVVAANENSLYADRSEHAARLARDLLEEITSKSYQDPDQAPLFGPEANETTRSLYDDVDDYNGYAESANNLKDATGALYSGMDQQFGRSVTVAATSDTVTELGQTFQGVTVTVVVTHTTGSKWTFSRLILKP